MAEPQIGITEATEALCQSVELEKSLSEVVRKDKDGGFGVGHTFDPQVTGTLKVLGTTSDSPGSDLATALSSLSEGVTLVTDVEHALTNDDFDETTISFRNAPGAS
jgi:hypothetical protein